MKSDQSVALKSLTAPEYVLALFESADNVAILVRNRSLGNTLQRITKAHIIAAPEFQSVLLEQNRAGADVFIGMNPIKDGAYSRTKQSLKEIRHVYLDLDRNGDHALQAIRNSLEVPPPNFVLHTSPGKHQVVWRIQGLNLEQGEILLHGMASQFGGDLAATDAARVLRLPGFANRKLTQEFFVQAVQESDTVYSARDFNLPEDSPEAPRRIEDGYGSHRLARYKSQSERDWAYAKRALARGDDPEDVIRRIADYRGDEKHSTYASRTVEKAQADLQDKPFVHPSRQPGDAVQDDSHRSEKSSPARR